MSYLGTTPTTGYSKVEKQTIIGNGGTSYILTYPVGNEQEIEVFVNDVRQNPGIAYSASGKNLIMANVVGANDSFYLVYQGKAEIIPYGVIPEKDNSGNYNFDIGTLFIDASNNEVGIGTTDPTSNLHVIGTANVSVSLTTGAVSLNGTITPSIIAANTDNWAPGTTGIFEVRAGANSNVNIEYNVTGLVAGANGQVIVIVNTGTSPIVLRNQDAGSNNENRFAFPNHVKLYGSQTLPLYYDGISQKWRPIYSVGLPYMHKTDLTKGFFSGGQATVAVATSDRTNYSTETTSAVSGANLSQARQLAYAAGNADKGFFSGGYTSVAVATSDRTNYSTETTAAVSGTNLSSARYAPAAAGNADKGFFSGGLTSVVVATSDRTNYSTETTSAVSGANLSQARRALAAA